MGVVKSLGRLGAGYCFTFSYRPRISGSFKDVLLPGYRRVPIAQQCMAVIRRVASPPTSTRHICHVPCARLLVQH